MRPARGGSTLGQDWRRTVRRGFGLTRGGASQTTPGVLFSREMVLIVHGFPSAVAALRVRTGTGRREDGLGLGVLAAWPPSPRGPETLPPGRSSSGPGSTRRPHAAWRTWLRACAARPPSLSTCACWRTCCARRPGFASRSPCVGCAPISAGSSARRRRRTYRWPSGLRLPGRRTPGAAAIPLLTLSPRRTRTL